MLILYNFLLIIIYPFYYILHFFSKRIKNFYHSRKTGLEQIQIFLDKYKNQKKIWLHASSAGELEQLLALFRLLKNNHPEIPILITVFSLSVKNLENLPSEGKAYLPIDLGWKIKLKNLKFDIFITFTWDTFPNLLKLLKKNNCYNFLCSAAIDSNSYRLKYPTLFKFFYQFFDGIGVVDEENYNNFKKIFNKKIYIIGDSRYDAIFYKLKNIKISKTNKEKLKVAKDILILASTYKECDLQLFPYLEEFINNFPDKKIWIFPHHVDNNRIQETYKNLLRYELKNIILFSDDNFLKNYKSSSIVIVDSLGILAYAYLFSKVCYVGGGFHHRIHNTGEPASCGCIPFTGPKIDSSPVAKLLWKNHLLYKHNNGKELMENIIKLYKNKKLLNIQSKKIKNLMYEQKGSTEKFYNQFLKEIIDKF